MAMHTWFECRIRYEKMMDNGMQKKVTEPYLVDALSFTEAEARIIEEMTPFISGEFTVSDIKRANYSELFPSNDEQDDRWFKCKLVFITLDEKSGAEKCTSLCAGSGFRPRPCEEESGRSDEGNNGGLSGSCGNGDGYYGCLSVYGIR